MSYSHKTIKLDLRHALEAISDVTTPDGWYRLGLALGLSPGALDTIQSHPDLSSHKRMMLRKWLQGDVNASWKKLAFALTAIGHEVLAQRISSQYNLGVMEPAAIEEDERCMLRHFIVYIRQLLVVNVFVVKTTTSAGGWLSLFIIPLL